MTEEVFTTYHLQLQGMMLKRIFQKGGLHPIPGPVWFAAALSRRGVGRKAASDAGGFSDIPSSDCQEKFSLVSIKGKFASPFRSQLFLS
jgi:hypothetical protein